MSFLDVGSNKQGQPSNNNVSNLAAFTVSYQLSPIILVGGLAQNISGGMLPIVSLLQSQDYDLGVLSQSSPTDLSDFFANFTVEPNSTLIENQIAHWPLANLTVAANDVIAQPLRVFLRMVAPARGDVSYVGKQSVMTALQTSLIQHTNLGGWYNVCTPSYIWEGCLLVSLRDVSDVQPGGQVQHTWRWEFEQPLITTAAAQGAQNTAMAKITSQTQSQGDPPGSQVLNTSAGNPSSNVASTLIPAARNPIGSNVVPAGTQSGATPALSTISPISPGG